MTDDPEGRGSFGGARRLGEAISHIFIHTYLFWFTTKSEIPASTFGFGSGDELKKTLVTRLHLHSAENFLL